MGTKTCSHCQTEKPASDFYRNSGRKDGLSDWCRPCVKADRHKRWRAKHPEPPPYVRPTEKTCKTCGQIKPLEQFHRRSSARDGRQPDCAVCATAAIAAYHKSMPGEHARRVREYYARHPERKADNSLQWRLGIPRGTYDAMFAAQEGKCAICGTADPGPRLKRFHVDHCHDTNQIRALLCSACNMGLGAFRDKSDLLTRAAEYLDSYPK